MSRREGGLRKLGILQLKEIQKLVREYDKSFKAVIKAKQILISNSRQEMKTFENSYI